MNTYADRFIDFLYSKGFRYSMERCHRYHSGWYHPEMEKKGKTSSEIDKELNKVIGEWTHK